ncbi:MAG: TIGR02147 family protein [Bacteriovoracaceae bacterium]
MNEQVKVQQMLQKKFLEIRSKNPDFSIRALANKLQMQPSATNEILKGQRRVSRKVAEKIADNLQLDPSERVDLLKDFPLKLKRNSKKQKSQDSDLLALKLNSEQFSLISEWTHFAILSLMRLKDFKSDISWIAERLGISDVAARKAIIRLQHLNLIRIEENGVMTRTPHPVRTTDDVRDLSLQQMHLNDMEIAKEKMKEISLDQRDFTNFTFPANPQKMKLAKEILRKAQDDLEELMCDEEASEVYRACMYLFPLTKFNNDRSIQ